MCVLGGGGALSRTSWAGELGLARVPRRWRANAQEDQDLAALIAVEEEKEAECWAMKGRLVACGVCVFFFVCLLGLDGAGWRFCSFFGGGVLKGGFFLVEWDLTTVEDVRCVVDGVQARRVARVATGCLDPLLGRGSHVRAVKLSQTRSLRCAASVGWGGGGVVRWVKKCVGGASVWCQVCG